MMATAEALPASATSIANRAAHPALIQERTTITNDQIEGLFREAQTKDAAFAVGCGIVHEIHDVQIPAGAPVVSLVFKR